VLLPNGSVVVYVLPPFDSGYFYTLDVNNPRPVNVVELFEPIGAVQCDLQLGCYGHRIVSDFAQHELGTGQRAASDELVKVNMETGDIETLCRLKKIIGYELGISALDAKNGVYYGVMVNTTATAGSNQWLVTIDVNKGRVVSSAPVDMDFGGPLVVDEKHGLLTFGSSLGSHDIEGEKLCLMAKVDPGTGEQTCLFGEDAEFVPIVLPGGAAAKGGFVVVSDIVGPYTYRLLTLDVRGDTAIMVHNASIPELLQSFAFDPSANLLV
jgi:hypothetical protein